MKLFAYSTLMLHFFVFYYDIVKAQEVSNTQPTLFKSAPRLVLLSELPYTGAVSIIVFILVGIIWGFILIYFLSGRKTRLKIQDSIKKFIK